MSQDSEHATPGITASYDVGPAALLVRLIGEIDASNSTPLADQILATAARSQRTRVTLDMAGVAFMDSSGLKTLIRCRNELAQRDGRLDVLAVNPQVRRIFEMTGLLDLIDDDPDRVAT